MIRLADRNNYLSTCKQGVTKLTNLREKCSSQFFDRETHFNSLIVQNFFFIFQFKKIIILHSPFFFSSSSTYGLFGINVDWFRPVEIRAWRQRSPSTPTSYPGKKAKKHPESQMYCTYIEYNTPPSILKAM